MDVVGRQAADTESRACSPIILVPVDLPHADHVSWYGGGGCAPHIDTLCEGGP
jgi:hypothetical protein